MIEIERDRCTRCGWCVDECPAGILVREAPGGSSSIVAQFEEACTFCGHCVAICPARALSHHAFPADLFEERECTISPDLMRDFLLARRSTRSFQEKTVPRAIMERLIEVGIHAGTASNAQTEGFVVVQDRGVLTELEKMAVTIMWNKLKALGNPVGRRMARLRYGNEVVERSIRYYKRFKAAREKGQSVGLVLRNAPAVIAIHGERLNQSVHENCAIAARNIEMLAKSLGLGTCWAGFFLIAAGFSNTLARRLGLPDARNVYSALMVGYPNHVYTRLIPRKEREVRWL